MKKGNGVYSGTVYLSGPMTGRPDYNRAAFEVAANVLRALGNEVINPHELPEPEGLTGDPEKDWCLYLARDLVLIAYHVNIIVALPAWDESRGSRLEIEFARRVGKRIVYMNDEIKQ